VRENYHSGLLIGNDSKMNGRLNSEAADRKTLRSVDFGAHGSTPRRRQRTLFPLKWMGGVGGAKFSDILPSQFALVHNLSQALYDGGESGALELRVNRR